MQRAPDRGIRALLSRACVVGSFLQLPSREAESQEGDRTIGWYIRKIGVHSHKRLEHPHIRL